VVKLPESKVTLYSLFTFIFPVAPILPSTTEKIMELLAVAQKYQMDSVMTHIRGAIARLDPPFIRPETALRIYFLTQKYELYQEALQAARVTLRLSMIIEDLGDNLEFHGMTGAYLHELWKYHERIRTDLKSGLLEFRNSGLSDEVQDLRCTDLLSSRWIDESSDHSFPQWLDDYIDSIAEAPRRFDLIEFENARASHITINTGISINGGDFRRSATCSCVVISGKVIRAFWEALTAVVHRVIDKVRTLGSG